MSDHNQANSGVANRIPGKKSNKAFMILSALGILFVVDDHLGKPLSILTSVFPYDSFFMPMFTFISGYFFKEEACRSWRSTFRYGMKKFRSLMLPYLGWILFYQCLNSLLVALGIWRIGGTSLREIIYGVVTTGVIFAFNSPAWFAPLLFCVSVCYCLIRRIFHRCWNETLVLVVTVLLGAAAVYGAGTSFNVPLHYMLLKVPFFLPFYHMGSYFRSHLEHHFRRCSAGAVCLCAAAVNIVLLGIYGNTLEFSVCSAMAGFQTGNPLLPFLTSITGIAFWLKISDLLVPVLGQSRLVNYISENTFFIMTHHIGVKHLFIALCLLGSQLGLSACSGIDVHSFLTDGLYLYTAHPWCKPACFVFTMAVLLVCCNGWQRLTFRLKSCIKKP